MEDYNYIERREQIRKGRRKLPKKRESYFILKLNAALAIGVMVLCARLIDLDVSDTLLAGLEKAVTQSVDLGEIKTNIVNAAAAVSGGEGISVFAKDEHFVTMDDSLVSQMNEQAAAYENAQKKTPEK